MKTTARYASRHFSWFSFLAGLSIPLCALLLSTAYVNVLNQPIRFELVLWSAFTTLSLVAISYVILAIFSLVRSWRRQFVESLKFQITETFLRAVVDGQASHVVILNKHGDIVYVNEAWKRFWTTNGGKDVDFPVNYFATCDNVSTEETEDGATVSGMIRRVISGESDYETLTYDCHSSSQARWFKVVITPLRGSYEGAVVAHHEVTDQVLAHEALSKANEQNLQLAQIVKRMTNLVVSADLQGNIVWCNESFLRIAGFESSEILGKSIDRIVGGKLSIESQGLSLAEAVRVGKGFRGEVAFRTRDGKETFVDLDIQPQYEQERIVGILLIGSDITKLVNAREKAEDSLRELNTILNAFDKHALLSIADPDGRIKDVNSGFCRRSGFGRDELIGSNYRILSSGFHSSEFWHEVWECISTGDTWRGEVCNQKKDGTLFWVDTTIVPCVDAEGSVEQFISYHFDITETKTSQQKLADAQWLLEKTGQLAKVGGWSLDLNEMRPIWSEEVYRIHEVELNKQITLEEAVNFYAPQARQAIIEAVQRGIDYGESWDLELPIITATGKDLWVRATGVAETKNGKCIKLWGALQDITEQRDSKAKLQQLATRMKVATEGAGISVFEYEPESEKIIVDQTFLRILGWEGRSEDISIENFFDRVHSDDRHVIEDGLARLLESGGPMSVEYRIVREDNRIRYIKASATTELGENGKRLVVGTVVDVTEKHLAEERLSLAMRTSKIGLWDWYVETGDTYFSDTFYTMLGYTPNEMPMNINTWKTLCHPDDWQQAEKDLHDHFNGVSASYRNEHRLRCKDGSWKWISDVGEIIEYNSEGSPLRMIGVHVDVQELKEISGRFELAIKSANAGVWDWHVQNGTFRTNDQFHLMLGDTPEDREYPIEYFQERLHPDDVVPTQQSIEAAHASDDFVYDVEFRFRCHDGSYKWLHSTGRVIERERDGKPIRMVGQQIDVDANRRAREDIERLNVDLAKQISYAQQLANEAEAANLAKSEFLANMSHEIRTPMTAILGFAETLAESKQTDENKSSIEVIRRNGEHLLRVINDILDLSKIESGKFQLEEIECSPHDLLLEVLELMQIRADSKGLSWRVELENDIPIRVLTDPTRLRQILINLTANAIKFTELGGVRLVTKYFQDAGSDYLEFNVIDTGIGISDRQMEGLFQPFVQADTSMSRKFGGTGLGLTISKRFANLLGGDLQATSKFGAGSNFTLTIKVVVPPDTEFQQGLEHASKTLASQTSSISKSESIGQPLVGKKLLLVEDGPDNQRLISFVLKRAGAEVLVAENGQVAVDAVVQAENDQAPFDLIVMDMQMPIMDGYQATAKLRELNFTCPIIALTAHAMASDRQKCLDSGCDDYATKPINREELIEQIANMIGRQTENPSELPQQ